MYFLRQNVQGLEGECAYVLEGNGCAADVSTESLYKAILKRLGEVVPPSNQTHSTDVTLEAILLVVPDIRDQVNGEQRLLHSFIQKIAEEAGIATLTRQEVQ
jgi:hypothetical protein